MTKRHIIWGASIAVLAGILVAQTQQRTPAQPVQSAPGGRYQLVINPNVRADTFLLDTATGRIWIPVEYTGLKGNPTAWTPQARVDSESALYAWEQAQTVKPETTTPEPK